MKKNSLKIGILAILFAVLIFAKSISVSASAGLYFNGGYKLVSNKGAALTCETQNPYVASVCVNSMGNDLQSIIRTTELCSGWLG